MMFSVGMFSYYSMQQIGLPVLAKLQHQPEEQRAAIFKTMRLVSLLCLPLLVLLGLAADPLVPLLFGANWWGSVAAFRVLCCLNIFYALSLMAGQVLLSAGYPAAYMRLAAGNVAIFLVCVTIAAPYGIVAAALAGGLANMLAVPLYFLALRRILGISLRRLAVEQLPAWFAVGVMALAVLGLGSLFGAAPGVPQLLMTLLAGGAVFVGVMAVIAREQIGDLVASVAAAGSRSESS